MNRVTFSTPRGCFRAVGIVFASIAGILLVGTIVGLTSDREREPVEFIVLVLMAIVAVGFMLLGIAVSVLRRECTIDRDAGTVEAGWYLIRPLHVRRERLSAFGAVTLTSGVSRRTDASGRMSNMPDRVSFKVCLIRGNRDEATSVACFDPGSGVFVHANGREERRVKADLSPEERGGMMDRLWIVKSVQEDAEAARQVAAEIARFTGLPFGHPTLGPDSPDPAMQPLDLDPGLCIRCTDDRDPVVSNSG